MAIVSVSLPDEDLAAMDEAIAQGEYRGRSEFIRAALRTHLTAHHAPAEGHVHGSVTLVYPEGGEATVSTVRHAFHDVVLSMMHTHCETDTCMDVLIVGGPAARIEALGETLARMRGVTRSNVAILA